MNDNANGFLCTSAGAGNVTARGPPTTFFRTIFLDNNREREGNNIDRNVSIMMNVVRGTYQPPSNRELCFDSAVRKRLLEAACRSLQRPSPSPKASSMPTKTNIHKDHVSGNTTGVARSQHPDPAKGQDPIAGHDDEYLSIASASSGEASLTASCGSLPQYPRDDRAQSPGDGPFVSTVRGLYGGAPPAPPVYVQSELDTLEDLRRFATAATADDDEGVDWGLKPPPAGLSRILKHNERLALSRDGNGACPHCDLTREHAPVYQVLLHHGSGSGGTAAATAPTDAPATDPTNASLSSTLRKIGTSETAFRRLQPKRYGNLCLGILTPDDTLERLWQLTAMLQPPKELQLANYPPAQREKIPQLSTDEWAIIGATHFTKTVGVPPWTEFFIRQKREMDLWTLKAQRECDEMISQIRECQTSADSTRSRIQTLERIVDIRNPKDELGRLRSQLQTTQQEVVLRRWELEDTKARIERDELVTLKDRAITAVAHEEIRRSLAQIGDMMELSRTLLLPSYAERSEQLRRDLLTLLESLPTSKGHQMKKLTSMMRPSDMHQCPSCLLLSASSPFCPMTGAAHPRPSSTMGGSHSPGHSPTGSSFSGGGLDDIVASFADCEQLSEGDDDEDVSGSSQQLLSDGLSANPSPKTALHPKKSTLLAHVGRSTLAKEVVRRNLMIQKIREGFAALKLQETPSMYDGDNSGRNSPHLDDDEARHAHIHHGSPISRTTRGETMDASIPPNNEGRNTQKRNKNDDKSSKKKGGSKSKKNAMSTENPLADDKSAPARHKPKPFNPSNFMSDVAADDDHKPSSSEGNDSPTFSFGSQSTDSKNLSPTKVSPGHKNDSDGRQHVAPLTLLSSRDFRITNAVKMAMGKKKLSPRKNGDASKKPGSKQARAGSIKTPLKPTGPSDAAQRKRRSQIEQQAAAVERLVLSDTYSHSASSTLSESSDSAVSAAESASTSSDKSSRTASRNLTSIDASKEGAHASNSTIAGAYSPPLSPLGNGKVAKGRKRGRREKVASPPPPPPPPLAALEAISHHTYQFLSAAADRDFQGMREITRALQQKPMYSTLFTESTLRSLTDIEEQFYSWFSIVGRLRPQQSDPSVHLLLRKCKIMSLKAVEQKCLILKKELRNLEYAFRKRPKGRSGGATLDDSSFAALALKITELEKKNAALRIKLRQVNEQRRAIATAKIREMSQAAADAFL